MYQYAALVCSLFCRCIEQYQRRPVLIMSVRVCACVLSRKGEKIYCNLAISVFIYNDWAFAIQNVSLYIEYENIYDLCMYETCNWLGFVVLQQFLLLKWYEFVLKGLTLLSYALCLWGERSCLVGGLLQNFCFFSRNPSACPQTLTQSVFSSKGWSPWVGIFIPPLSPSSTGLWHPSHLQMRVITLAGTLFLPS